MDSNRVSLRGMQRLYNATPRSKTICKNKIKTKGTDSQISTPPPWMEIILLLR